MQKNTIKPDKKTIHESQAKQTRLRNLLLKSERWVDSLFGGNYRSRFRGPGLEFLEARPYVAGDDIRFIDWNVSSRLNDTYCKVFIEERDMTLMLVVDVSSSMSHTFYSKKANMAEEIFALLGFAALNHGDHVGSMAFDDDIVWFNKAKRNKKYFVGQVRNLIHHDSKSKGSNLAKALQYANETMKRRGICVLISDFNTEGYWKELGLLARRHDVVAIRLEDIFDRKIPSMGYIPVIDPEEYTQAGFYPRSRRFQEEYTGYWQTMLSQWRQNCTKRHVKTLVIRSDEDVSKKLVQFFKRGHGT